MNFWHSVHLAHVISYWGPVGWKGNAWPGNAWQNLYIPLCFGLYQLSIGAQCTVHWQGKVGWALCTLSGFIGWALDQSALCGIHTFWQAFPFHPVGPQLAKHAWESLLTKTLFCSVHILDSVVAIPRVPGIDGTSSIQWVPRISTLSCAPSQHERPTGCLTTLDTRKFG